MRTRMRMICGLAPDSRAEAEVVRAGDSEKEGMYQDQVCRRAGGQEGRRNLAAGCWDLGAGRTVSLCALRLVVVPKLTTARSNA